MSFGRIRGQARALELLRRSLDARRLPHALLFSGPDGVGKRQTALELAKALNCAGPAAERDACDACAACRLADRGAHPDLLAVTPDGRSLKIAQVREVEGHVALSAYAGRRRVAVLDAAELMTLEAANAFLKTLEEPPSAAVLILISSAPTGLLPTIRSRCQEVRFGPLPEDVVAALLAEQGIETEEARRAAALGGGSLTLARAWAERFPREKQDQVLQETQAGLASPGRALALAKKLHEEYKGRRDLVPWLLFLLAAWARGQARRPPEAGAAGAARPEHEPVSPRTALAFYDAVAAAQAALESNVNLQLALEAMLLRMHAARRGQLP
ncbi:MAG TPA: DNA polymerase III subunit delta' [Candidatus Sulfotelmatobacter sp.]|nr:DNA polymerase III subunit delta' [Candidatus Sulfotelmatobacter sp.]